MLTIQKASAGSGKTYTLAKTYIRLMITIPVKGRHPRLRKDREIGDALRHILAVTFTNKATDEMKLRIINRLADMATFTKEDLAKSPKDWPDYLHDIATETHEDPMKVVQAARTALNSILFDYSNFSVSTIDSFFQTILRTFAYETDLNDNYQLEINAEATNSAGIDATLEDIVSNRNPRTRRWLNDLMKEQRNGGTSWNPFQKSDSKKSLYNILMKNVEKMESEDFKTNTAALDKYFASPIGKSLYQSYTEIKHNIKDTLTPYFLKVREVGKQLYESFAQAGMGIKEYGRGNLESQLKYVANGSDFMPTKVFNPSTSTNAFKANLKGLATSPKESPFYNEIQALHIEFNEAYGEWKREFDALKIPLWEVYSELLPFVPILHDISENIHEILTSGNTMQISDTNTMLHKIIAEDETPFIYERLGSRINHFLIDEFQDTSRLQWSNFYPLLLESESYNFENLIIGDAKQSIYRFRNAEPDLIVSEVPGAFPGHHPAGNCDAENTNHRSLRRIVDFNNHFFDFLSKSLSDNLANLYSNVRQPASEEDPLGYVEVNFFNSKEKDEENSKIPTHFSKAGELVRSILDRGYRQKDIAFLVTANDDGIAIIDSLIQYNSRHEDPSMKIEFISDQSLLISNSRAVKTIISSFRTIGEGLDSENNSESNEDIPEKENYSEKKSLRPKSTDWYKIASRFSYMSTIRPDAQPHEIINQLMNGLSPSEQLAEMLKDMQSVTLPSLTEAIIEHSVSQDLRRSDAPFLAAFQDCVMAYCESKPSDIASFLDWWDSYGNSLSIASSEDIEGVRIMTIHKSKGLEFPVVILPNAKMNFTYRSNDWSWVEPDKSFPQHNKLPPLLPIIVSKKLEGTPHEHLYKEAEAAHKMDKLNLAYVGFTRAVNELYVYAGISFKDNKGKMVPSSKNIGTSLFKFAEDTATINSEPLLGGNLEDDYVTTLTFGSPLQLQDLEYLKSRKSNNNKVKHAEPQKRLRKLEDYHVCRDCAMLTYVPNDNPPMFDDEDPRSEGNIMHEIMSNVIVAEDLDRSLLKMSVRGIVDPKTLQGIGILLKEAMKREEHRGWFNPGWKVINERDIALNTKEGKRYVSRPDRVMVDAEGNAVVIDYKFGHKTEEKRYERQVSNYMRALKKAGYKTITGYLWYVTESKVQEIK
ncbi:MAG: UvrD-helicase domain-containing protein [Clostridium sp.]|nr:UvrD-helicase domain-containing protein [Prevotella sp.]MCM1428392.1 UvrD-helicase domain-containing protein [Clostridium sp.]MCM1474864.1 UvrD-helicase domain-containing protein [Muribaculaceae bacterium]